MKIGGDHLWDAVGAIGEIVGALAVLGTLIYLAIQVRAQIAESREASMQLAAEAFRQSGVVFRDRELAEIAVKANTDDELTEVELLQLYSATVGILRAFEEAHRLYIRNRLDSEIWDGMQRQYMAMIPTPAVMRVWKARREFFNPAFRTLVDSSAVEPLGRS